MCKDCWRARNWRDKARVWVARTGWQPADVAASHPRHKNDLSTFEKYDPKVPAVVAWYGFFQLVVVVVFLSWMQAQEMSYWTGVACWGLLLATTMTTAFWLEARESGSVMRWEWLRLGGLAVLLVFSLNLGVDVMLVGVVYLVVNLLFLLVMSRVASAGQPDETVVMSEEPAGA